MPSTTVSTSDRSDTSATHLAELTRQRDRLVDSGLLAHIDPAEVTRAVAALEPLVAALPAPVPVPERVPFVLVPNRSVVGPRQGVEATVMGSRSGFTSMTAEELETFVPVDAATPPGSLLYLVTDVDTGPDYLGWTPQDALPHLLERGRTPLTVEEGVALVLQHEGVLKERNAFHTQGSRSGDKRVPGLWVSDRRPRLGWCWERNHHTWLGMGTAGGRIG